MKSFIPIFALAAAGVEATFKNASPFKCPANTDNKCNPKQSSGFDWKDLNLGGFANYGDFNFNGWTCGSGGPGGRFTGQPSGKFISGTCHSDKGKSPSFGCGPAVDKFSLGAIRVEPEFDCDLEFHYEMPDGSSCKHRNACKKSGTLVKNTQCGGAKKVTIVYPPQPNKPKQSCSIKVPTVSFDCSTASSTKPATSTKASSTSTSQVVTTTSEVKTTSTSAAETSSAPAESVSSVKPEESTTATVPAEGTTTAPGESTITTAPGESTTVTLPGEETTSVSPGESTVPAEESSTVTVPGETPTSPAETPTSPAETATAPGETTTATVPGEGATTTVPVPGEETTSVVTLSTPITTVITTEFESTSTIFSTVVSTITQCEPTVPDCPANGGVTTTVVTVAVSTTLCPVTETLTSVISTSTVAVEPSSAPGGGDSTVVAPGTSVAPGVTSAPGEATSTLSIPSSGIVTSVKPVETLPCPNVVPSCLNTFMFSVGCKDNTDADCYCPDAIFVKNIYDCIYAHGESDQIISEAVIFFQGICAPWVDKNPAVITAPTVTSYITVTAAPTVAPVYTTIVVDTTKVEPCTDDAGEVIPGSSTTVILATTVPVPQVGFTTGTSGGVDIIPITAAPVFNGGDGNNGGGAVVTGITGNATTPTGTGSIRPTQSVVFAGSNRLGTSFGLAAGIALLAAFGL